MKIGDEVYIHGYVDEIRQDTVIIRNDGGYFGTAPSEVAEQQPREDCIDRYSALAELDPLSYEYKAIKELPSVVPTMKTEECCAGCKWEYKWMKECEKCSRCYADNYERKEE